MNEDSVQALILSHFSNLKIVSLVKIGEGTGNVAYEVNTDLIFRFPKKEDNQQQLEQEIYIQEVLKQFCSLPYPDFIFLPADHSFIGYKKLNGTPLLQIYDEFKGLPTVLGQLGHFLTKLHSISSEKLNELNLVIENDSYEDWKSDAYSYFEKIKEVIPTKYLSEIERFFESENPKSFDELVLCHNDLGIEHILVVENNITGIIDWGGVALTDPACDLSRIYRDLGQDALNTLLRNYTDTSSKEHLQERAIFYGKCLFFEDLFYGTEQEEYLKKSMNALEWMFSLK